MATPQYVTLFYIVALCDHVGWSVTNCGGTKKVTNCGGAKKCDILWWRKKHSKNGYTAICHAFLHCSTLWPCWMKCDKLWWRKKNVTYCGGTKNAAAKMATPQYVTLFYIVALCDHVGWSVTNCGGTKKVTNCGGAKKCDILWWRKKHSKNGYTAICHAFLHCSTLWPCWMKCDKLWWHKKKWQIVVAQKVTNCGGAKQL